MKNKYSPFYTAYATSVQQGNPYTKEEVVQNFTEGRTGSLKQLTAWELQELVRSLRSIAKPATPENDKADKMRKAIIAIFKSMNKTTASAIQWAEKQGVKSIKKGFNQYSTGELYVLIQIAEKIKQDWQKSIRKQVANHNNTL